MEDCADADRRKANDAVFDPHTVSLERDEEADLGPRCLVEVALGKLEDGEEDDADGPEDREENPVQLVEKPKVGAAFENKATVSESDQYCPVGPSLTYLQTSSIIALISFRCISKVAAQKLLLHWDHVISDKPEEHAEEKGVEVDGDDNRSGEMEELAPKLVLLCLPAT